MYGPVSRTTTVGLAWAAEQRLRADGGYFAESGGLDPVRVGPSRRVY